MVIVLLILGCWWFVSGFFVRLGCVLFVCYLMCADVMVNNVVVILFFLMGLGCLLKVGCLGVVCSV